MAPACWIKLLLIAYVWIVESTQEDTHEIRLCSVGLGYFGRLAAKIAITKKNVNLVAAFTRTSYLGEDIGDVLGLGYKYGVIVSPVQNMEQVLEETKPNICFDAAQTLLSGVYENYVTLLSHKVNIISLAEQHVYPYDVAQGEYYEKINQLAIDNGVTVFGTGYQDLYLQQFALALSSAMLRIDRVDVTWSGDFNSGLLIYASYAGLGLSLTEYYEQGTNNPDENVFAHLMKEWNIAMAKWYADTLGFEKEDNSLMVQLGPIINDGEDVYAKAMERDIGKGYNLGANITSSLSTKEGVDIYFRNELKVYAEGTHRKEIEIALFGDPEVKRVVVPVADVENGTVVSAINRIPQILNAKAGYYNVDEMEVGLAKYWKGVVVTDKEQDDKAEL